MVPFILLIVSFLIFRLIGFFGLSYFDVWETSLRSAVALMFLFTAMAHWGKRRPDLIKMVPPALPNPDFIVTATGILEIIGAIGLLIPITSNIASLSLALLLIVMFPSNIRAARKGITIGGRPSTPLFPRTILQIIFLTAVILAG
ncbi:DoxX family membrane protein [Cytobacillus depressus]|uniref:DoxX family membrane protein n=1 Tax=Cytobacillus depressus TaxID=1602942 RepID=A0A6L3V8Q8_9BACI|nr:DoxX family protein [Cytobacillus depressus]KAB2336821.1 DoxX family membrane protein [Cytobacillus depressus]